MHHDYYPKIMIDYKNHWDKVYSKNDLDKLGWYEETPQPSLDLINSCNLNKDAAILDVGSEVSISGMIGRSCIS